MSNHMNKCVVCGEVKPTWNPTMFYEPYGSEKCTCTYCLAEAFSEMLKAKDTRIAALEAERDALAARCEVLRAWLSRADDIFHCRKVGGVGAQDAGYCKWCEVLYTTHAADLSAHDARVRREAQIKVDDLAMLVRQLVHSIRKTNPDNETASRAMDYLKRHGLQGSLLRALGPAQETK